MQVLHWEDVCCVLSNAKSKEILSRHFGTDILFVQ